MNPKNICSCGRRKTRKSARCIKCNGKRQRTFPIEDAIDLRTQSYSFRHIGRILGCTSTRVQEKLHKCVGLDYMLGVRVTREYK